MSIIINKYVEHQKLDKLVKSQYSTERNGLTYHVISFGETIKIQGVYYVNVADQRKGMNNFFYTTFKEYLLWGKKEDFDLAYDCIDVEYFSVFGEKGGIDALSNFKDKFVDNFDFGKSLLSPSF